MAGSKVFQSLTVFGIKLYLRVSVLEYAGTIWDPHCIYLEEQLEKVQKRAARFVLNNYSYEEGSMSEIMEILQWKPLKERRREDRLILFYKGLIGQAKIPTTDVCQNNRKNRNRHNQQFYIPYARIDNKTSSSFLHLFKLFFQINTVWIPYCACVF
jgi:thiol-disulfide isomerase/thioredoxin